MGHPFHFFRLFLLSLLLFLFIDFFNLRFVALFTLLFLLLLFVFRVCHLLLLGLLDVQLDWKTNELRMLLDQVFQAALFEKLRLIFLEVANHFRTTLDFAMNHLRVFLYRERATCSRLPDVLFVIVVFTYNSNFIRHQVCGVEANAELADHRNISPSGHRFHESFGTRLGNGTKIVDELILRHSNARVVNTHGGVGLIWNDLDEEVWLRFNLLWVGDRLIADLVQGIRRIGDNFTQEDFLIRVEGVN